MLLPKSHASASEARTRLFTVLEQALRLLHPFMPYITEDLWLRLPGKHQTSPSGVPGR